MSSRRKAASVGVVLQAYLAHKRQPLPWDPTVGLCLGPYGGPGEVGVSYERDAPLLRLHRSRAAVQGYLDHMKQPPSLGPS